MAESRFEKQAIRGAGGAPSSTCGSRPESRRASRPKPPPLGVSRRTTVRLQNIVNWNCNESTEKETFIDNLLIRILRIIVMIRCFCFSRFHREEPSEGTTMPQVCCPIQVTRWASLVGPCVQGRCLAHGNKQWVRARGPSIRRGTPIVDETRNTTSDCVPDSLLCELGFTVRALLCEIYCENCCRRARYCC